MEGLYRGHRFPREIISHAVWLYHRFTLSFREVEDLLAERGIIVSYEAIRYWCQKFGLVVRFRTCSEWDGTISKLFTIGSSETGLSPIGER